MPFSLVIKKNPSLVNFIIGIHFYYQNQPLLLPEFGVGIAFIDHLYTVGLRAERK